MAFQKRSGSGGRDFKRGGSGGSGGRSSGGSRFTSRPSGRDSYGSRGGGRDSGGYDKPRVEMHDAICDECGNRCQVPFRPSGDKPIYCSNCFESRGGNERRDNDRGSSRSFGGGRDSGYDRPRQDKPAYSAPSGVTKEQFDSLNKKLDKIIEALSAVTPREVVSEDGETKIELKAKKKVRVAKEEKLKLE